MKHLTVAALVLALVTGCGGGDGDDDDGQPAGQTSEAPAQEAAPTLTGEPTEAKLAKALKLNKAGGGYVSDSGCRFSEIVVGTDAVEAAKHASPKGIVTDDGGTYAVVMADPTDNCIYEAAFKIKAIR